VCPPRFDAVLGEMSRDSSDRLGVSRPVAGLRAFPCDNSRRMAFVGLHRKQLHDAHSFTRVMRPCVGCIRRSSRQTSGDGDLSSLRPLTARTW